jgi:hypothetical protein
MPEILRTLGFVFYFFSNEHEPIHIHVKGKGGFARFDLEPEIKLTDTKGLKAKDLKNIEKMLSKRRQYFINKWYEYFKRK